VCYLLGTPVAAAASSTVTYDAWGNSYNIGGSGTVNYAAVAKCDNGLITAYASALATGVTLTNCLNGTAGYFAPIFSVTPMTSSA
jgi:hypothetical protein